MNEKSMKRDSVLEALQRALEEWSRHGNEQPLTRWLRRELDSRGAPIRLPISDWPDCLQSVLRAEPRDGAWPSHWAEPVTRLIQASRWFTRKDGRPVTDFNSSKPKKSIDWMSVDFADALQGRCGGRIVQDWISQTKRDPANGEQPACGGSKWVLDVLRPGWPLDDDLLAIDHRDAREVCKFELFGAGQSWLGPTWTFGDSTSSMSPPRPLSSFSNSAGVVAEWSYRADQARITQSALMLGGRSLALLSMLVESRSAVDSGASMSLSMPPGIAAEPCENSRGVFLRSSHKRGSAQVLPIGLPALPYPTDRGTFLTHDAALILKQASAGRRCWLPLLVSWDSKRHRKDVHWRMLSVSEKSRNVPPDRAFAVRVSWGRDETYVVYRSFAKPAPRAFLGHQTTARLLIGLFTRDGAVEPILKVD